MKQQRLDNVQLLRGVAAFSVAIEHSFDQFSGHPIAGMAMIKSAVPGIWGSGVDLFFVISGFIMFYLTHDHFAEPGYSLEFLKRRVIRVAPTYWIFTTAMILVTIFSRESVNSGVGGTWHAISSYLFIPSPRPDDIYMPVFVLGWTLNYEFFFYVAFAIALLVPARIGLPALIGGFVALAIAHPLFPKGMIWFWSEPIILEFIGGILLAMAFVRGTRIRSGALALLLAITGIALFILFAKFAPHWPRIARCGVPAMALAGAAILYPNRHWWRGLILVGDASYSLYLSHPFALNLVTAFWRKLRLPSDGYSYFWTMVLACLLGGIAVYQFMERPLVGTLRRRFEPRRDTLAA